MAETSLKYISTHIFLREKLQKIKLTNNFVNLGSTLYSAIRFSPRNEVFLGVEQVVSR